MSTVAFRNAELEDIPLLNEISVKSKKHWGYPDEWIERWLDDLQLKPNDIQNHHILMMTIDDEAVGFCSIFNKDDSSEILHLWLLPVYIGMGYGKKLLEEALRKFVPPVNDILVEADPNAAPFYKRNGFKEIDRVESYPKGRYLPVMRKMANSK